MNTQKRTRYAWLLFIKPIDLCSMFLLMYGELEKIKYKYLPTLLKKIYVKAYKEDEEVKAQQKQQQNTSPENMLDETM